MAALERAAWSFIAYNFDFDQFFVVREAFDAVWTVNGGDVVDLRYQFFIRYFGLVAGVFEIIPDTPIDVYFVPSDLCAQFFEFAISVGLDCERGGDVVEFPDPGFSPCFPDEV